MCVEDTLFLAIEKGFALFACIREHDLVGHALWVLHRANGQTQLIHLGVALAEFGNLVDVSVLLPDHTDPDCVLH